MTDPAIPSAYVPDKRTAPPSREELRARIPGWGADLDPADRPSSPKLQYPADSGARWTFPERHPGGEGRERSVEHAFVTPVFGTAQPLRGASGAIRRLAYDRFSEGRLAHWTLLIVGDRVDAWGSHLRSFATKRPDNPITETGIKGEVTGHGIRSRVGQNRVDLKHQPLDALIVAAPWLIAGYAAFATARALRGSRRSRKPRPAPDW